MKSSTSNITRESRQIIDDIRRLVQAVRLASTRAEKKFGLSAAQLFVLHKLGDEKGLSINDLAERTLTHQSSVSVVVKKLEAKQLVKRAVASEDGRKLEIWLTQKGASLIRKSPETIQEQLINGLSKMKPAKRHQLAQYFSEFLSNAEIKGEATMLDEETHAKKKIQK
ncbi:MAG: MarR family transcriptional regulator [Ignavibacteriota bacterium]